MKRGHLWDLVLLVRCSLKRIEPDATTRVLGKLETTLSCYGCSPSFLCLTPKMTSGSPKPSQCHVTTQKSTLIQRASLCSWAVGRKARDYLIKELTLGLDVQETWGSKWQGRRAFQLKQSQWRERVREIIPGYSTFSKTTEPMKIFTFYFWTIAKPSPRYLVEKLRCCKTKDGEVDFSFQALTEEVAHLKP